LFHQNEYLGRVPVDFQEESMKLRNWLLGAIALIVMVGSVVPAEAQYHRHHRRHRHHRPYGR